MGKKNLLKKLMLLILLIATGINLNAATGNMIIAGNSTNLAADASGLGWRWIASTETLTITSAYVGSSISIQCQESDTINLVYDGNVSIVSVGADAISCFGSLNIMGNGTLYLAYTGTLYYYSPITCLNFLTVSSGTINAICSAPSIMGSDNIIAFHAAAIYAASGFNITGNANVITNVIGDNAHGLYTESGNSYISTTGTVTVNATGLAYSIYAKNQLTISNGYVNLSNNDTPANMIHINKKYKRFEMTGGTVKYNNGTPPSFSAIFPSSGTCNMDVTLIGNSLVSTTNVSVKGKEAKSFTVNSNNEIIFTSPSGNQGSANILVETSGGASYIPNGFTYTTTSYRIFLTSAGSISDENLGFIDVEANKTIAKPANPTLSGYKFIGWYKDFYCTEEWNFATDIVNTDNMYLYAKLDYDSSIEDINSDNDIKIYSSADGVSIESIDNIKTIEIFDSNGKLLQTFSVNSQKENITTSNLPKGIYLITAITESGNVSKKIVR